jgi:hypothetical protein
VNAESKLNYYIMFIKTNINKNYILAAFNHLFATLGNLVAISVALGKRRR